MTDYPEFDEVREPDDLAEKLKEMPEPKKELLTASARFGVFVVAVALILIINFAAVTIPALSHIPTELVISISSQVVVLAGTFIWSRTKRNTQT